MRTTASGERRSLDCDKIFEYRAMFDRCQVLEMKEECDDRRRERELMMASSANAFHMTSALRHAPFCAPTARPFTLDYSSFLHIW